MIITLVCLFLLCLYGIQFDRTKAFGNYFLKERTDSIKGIFIFIVFLSHIKQYILNAGYEYHGVGDMLFSKFMMYIGQLMVVMFLFYSGFGVMESIRNKGQSYVKYIPKRRILNTLINFDIAVCIFLCVALILGEKVTLSQFLLSLITWDSVGNSNWYIFAIILCYFTTWLTASIIKNPVFMCMGTFILLSIAAVVLHAVKEPYWYNTLWAYPAGMYFSINRNKIEDFIDSHYIPSLLTLLFLFVLIYSIPKNLAGFRMNLLSIFFALIIVTITMRIRIENPVLQWCGENLFPLYIYQRIPMIVLASALPSRILTEHSLIYISICLIITALLAIGYRYIKITLRA